MNMLGDIEAIANKYAIPFLLNVGLVVLFFGDFDAYKAFKYPKLADVLLFITLHFFWDKVVF